MVKVFLLAGEQSGDLHGGKLIKQLHQIFPNWKVEGIAGPLMRREGIDLFLPMEAFQVMGFQQIVTSLPKLIKQFKQVRNHILKTAPDIIVLIDYPGFNLRLAKSLRKNGYKGKIVQFICPTVWAHGKGRIPIMAQNLNLLLTIFPFEEPYFSGTPLKVKYIGHPLVEAVNQYSYKDDWQKELKIPNSSPLIGLFPGSRFSELHDNLGNMLQVAKEYKRHHPKAHFGLSCSHEKHKEIILQILHQHGSYLKDFITIVPSALTYELMRDCETAIAVSGTVTLELALHQKPTLVLYAINYFDRLIVKYFLRIRLPHYCIVNIIEGKTVFPELMETSFTLEAAMGHLNTLHSNKEIRHKCKEACRNITLQLHKENSIFLATEAIEQLLL